MEYQDQFITLNGCKLHFMDWGNPSAPPLLFVHGLRQQAHSFDGSVRRLRENYRCISLDLRGRGDSEWAPKETYTIPTYGKDVLGLLEALGIEKTHYVGTSLGGLIAMALASRQPDLFHSLVLNDIGPELSLDGVQRIASTTKTESPAFSSLEDYLEREVFPYYYWKKNDPREELLEAAQWALRKNEDGSFSLKYDPEVAGGVRDTSDLEAASKIMWEGFRNLDCPILLVRGGDSDLLTPETVTAMQKAQPTMDFAEVPGVNHAPSLNEPPAVVAMTKFFSLGG